MVGSNPIQILFPFQSVGVIPQHAIVVFISQVEVALTVHGDALWAGQTCGTGSGRVTGEVRLAKHDIGRPAAQGM